jgi:hypothetical protein
MSADEPHEDLLLRQLTCEVALVFLRASHPWDRYLFWFVSRTYVWTLQAADPHQTDLPDKSRRKVVFEGEVSLFVD